MRRLICISLLVFLAFPTRTAQAQDTHTRLKALFVYQFATLVDWPKEFKQGDFIIGIFGESPLFAEMIAKFSNKSVGSQAIKIKNYLKITDIAACHILFVAPEYSDKVGELVKKFKTKSTLIVTEREGKLKDGAIINFVINNNKQSFEISKTNAAKHKLIVGSKLEQLAARVE